MSENLLYKNSIFFSFPNRYPVNLLAEVEKERERDTQKHKSGFIWEEFGE